MRRQPIVLVLLAAAAAACAPVRATDTTPYAGQQKREIKALSSDEQADWIAGKGMGLAKAAELNGYPGPAHVLELADRLELSTEQRASTQEIFATMESEAQNSGRHLVDAERELDALFASSTITSQALTQLLDRIASLQAAVRRAHLQAHLDQARVLAPAQISLYTKLRGYADHGAHAGKHHPGH